LASVKPLTNRTDAKDLITKNDTPLKRVRTKSEPTRLGPSSLNVDESADPSISFSINHYNSSSDFGNGNGEFANDKYLDKSDGDDCDLEKYDTFIDGIIEEA
jgi:hypothetical protein